MNKLASAVRWEYWEINQICYGHLGNNNTHWENAKDIDFDRTGFFEEWKHLKKEWIWS